MVKGDTSFSRSLDYSSYELYFKVSSKGVIGPYIGEYCKGLLRWVGEFRL